MARRATITDRTVEALMDASRVLTGVVAHSMAEADSSVSVPGLRVLVLLASRGPVNMSTVAEALGVNASNATRTCDRLVEDDLVARRTSSNDRRQTEVFLTDSGQSFVDRLMEERRELLRRVVAAMPPAQRRVLAEVLPFFSEAARRSSSNGELTDAAGHLLRWLG